MIGFRSLTTSPSRSTTRRSTPCVAGWWGPMFTVITSVLLAAGPVAVSGGPAGGGCASVLGPPEPTPPAGETSAADALISAASAIVALVVGEGHGLAADREVTPLRPADVVVGQQDPRQAGVCLEDDAVVV